MNAPANTLSTARESTSRRPGDDPFRSGRKERWLRGVIVAAGLSGVAALIAIFGHHARLHAPRLDLLVSQPLALRVHVAAAFAALAIGFVLMSGPKGRLMHRILGWAWMAAMLTVATSSFLFPFVLKGHLDPFHAASAYVLIIAPMGLAAARRHDIRSHRIAMTNLFMFGLVVAGAFTFVPGRLMWRVVFG